MTENHNMMFKSERIYLTSRRVEDIDLDDNIRKFDVSNDSLEGFIINISRGSGLDGLTGIPIENNKIKRPLIGFEKSKIIDYAKSNNLNWREDSSNKTDSYLRNTIRNNIIPEFEKLEGNFIKNFKKSISYLQISNTIIHGKINELKKNLLEYRGDEIAIKIFDNVEFVKGDKPITTPILIEITVFCTIK